MIFFDPSSRFPFLAYTVFFDPEVMKRPIRLVHRRPPGAKRVQRPTWALASPARPRVCVTRACVWHDGRSRSSRGRVCAWQRRVCSMMGARVAREATCVRVCVAEACATRGGCGCGIVAGFRLASSMVLGSVAGIITSHIKRKSQLPSHRIHDPGTAVWTGRTTRR